MAGREVDAYAFYVAKQCISRVVFGCRAPGLPWLGCDPSVMRYPGHPRARVGDLCVCRSIEFSPAERKADDGRDLHHILVLTLPGSCSCGHCGHTVPDHGVIQDLPRASGRGPPEGP